jgi:hypothetical protein
MLCGAAEERGALRQRGRDSGYHDGLALTCMKELSEQERSFENRRGVKIKKIDEIERRSGNEKYG